MKNLKDFKFPGKSIVIALGAALMIAGCILWFMPVETANRWIPWIAGAFDVLLLYILSWIFIRHKAKE